MDACRLVSVKKIYLLNPCLFKAGVTQGPFNPFWIQAGVTILRLWKTPGTSEVGLINYIDKSIVFWGPGSGKGCFKQEWLP